MDEQLVQNFIANTKNSLISLEETLKLLDDTFYDTQHYIFFYNPSGEIIYLNEFAQQKLKIPKREIIGKTWEELGFTKESMHSYDAEREKVFNTGISLKSETIFSNNGQERVISYSFIPVKDCKDNVVGVLSIATDLTNIRMEVKTRELEERRMKAMIQLHEMSDKLPNELTDYTLEQLGLITDSPMGYLAFLNETEDVITMYSWSYSALKECEIIDKPVIYPLETTGLWGEAVRQRKAIITNDYQSENRYKKGYPEGHVQILRHMNVPIFDGGRIVALAGVGNKVQPYNQDDVTHVSILMNFLWSIIKQQRANQALLKSLHEKEALLREIHHRVKNNLQAVTSIIGLQSHYLGEGAARNVLDDTYNRIKSMAIIHEDLYKSETFSSVEFSEYLKSLVSDLLKVYGIQEQISLNLQLEPYQLNMETAVPLGLIANEIITNTLKHALNPIQMV